MLSVVSSIREQDQKRTKSLYFLMAYFTLSLTLKFIGVVEYYHKTSSMKGDGVEVALMLLFATAIPLTILQIRKIKRVSYNLPVEEFVSQAKSRYAVSKKTIFLSIILIAVTMAIMPLIDGWDRMPQPDFWSSLVKQHSALLLGICAGIAAGIPICHYHNKKIRTLLNVAEG